MMRSHHVNVQNSVHFIRSVPSPWGARPSASEHREYSNPCSTASRWVVRVCHGWLYHTDGDTTAIIAIGGIFHIIHWYICTRNCIKKQNKTNNPKERPKLSEWMSPRAPEVTNECISGVQTQVPRGTTHSNNFRHTNFTPNVSHHVHWAGNWLKQDIFLCMWCGQRKKNSSMVLLDLETHWWPYQVQLEGAL